MTVALEPARPGLWARLRDAPGLRTFQSRRYRTVVGILLWLIGLVLLGALLAGLAADPKGQFGIDFADYRTASLRMLEGHTPYAPEMLAGPVAAQGVDRYRYPPPFAQLLTPIAVLPFAASATAWLAVQVALIFASVWMAASAAGARPSLQRFVWTGVALTYFLPVFATLWTGNVEGPLALAVGALLAARGPRPSMRPRLGLGAGALAGLAAVIKLFPVALLPAALRGGRSLAAGTVVGIAILILPSLALVPQAWLDYARVLPNLLAGDARYANNLAPAIVALNLGAPTALADVVRLASLLAVVGLLVASAWLAGRNGAWSAAVACAVFASLLVPAALWYHYLTLLLPLGAFAWARAPSLFVRASLLGAGAAVSLGLAVLPLAALGGAWLGGTTLVALWPRRR